MMGTPVQVDDADRDASPNPFIISPRIIYEWMREGATMECDLLERAYVQTFQYLVHEVQQASKIKAAKPKLASSPNASSSAPSPAAAASPPTSVMSSQASALHSFTFNLFKSQFSLYREEGLRHPGERRLRPKRSVEEYESIVQKALSGIQPMSPEQVSEMEQARAVQSRKESRLPNRVYSLFHAMVSRSPYALSGDIHNICLASLVLFLDSGLDARTFSIIEVLTKHMTQSLGCRLDPATLGYIVDACLEQSQLEWNTGNAASSTSDSEATPSLPSPASATINGSSSSPYKDHRRYLLFAADLLASYRHTPSNPFIFDTNTITHVDSMLQPKLPTPTPEDKPLPIAPILLHTPQGRSRAQSKSAVDSPVSHKNPKQTAAQIANMLG